MKLRGKKVVNPYDIWENPESSDKTNKTHPSSKRSKKTPLPHPGQSYNPDPKDHQRLLQRVAEQEINYQKKQRSLKKAFDIKVSAKELRKNEKEELESGIEHLIKNNETSNDKTRDDCTCDDSSNDELYSDYDEKDFEAILKDKRAVENRKSRKQRLKQLKDRLQRKAAKLRKLKNIRLSKFDAIKKMVKELDKRDKEEATKKKHNRKLRNERFAQKFEKSDPIYCLSDELPSNLRKVSCPMNAIVREQLENFQSRLMVEPTSIQVRKRKYPKKEFNRLLAAEQEG